MSIASAYRLRFFFDWRAGSALWSGDDAASERYGCCVSPADLGLSSALQQEIARLAAWHDQALNWACPTDPGPWRQEECDRFNRAALALLEAIRTELGDRVVVVNEHDELHEDPDLHRYLADPRGFRRT